jgi:hypothetical protein
MALTTSPNAFDPELGLVKGIRALRRGFPVAA